MWLPNFGFSDAFLKACLTYDSPLFEAFMKKCLTPVGVNKYLRIIIVRNRQSSKFSNIEFDARGKRIVMYSIQREQTLI